MPRVFRRLRRLAMPDTAREYVVYGLGEIFLVVVGILIALQVNQWQEARDRLEERARLIHSIAADFETNRDKLERQMDYYRRVQRGLGRFLVLTAVSTGAVEMLAGSRLLELFTEFSAKHEDYKLHMDLSGNFVYAGGVWEMRRTPASALRRRVQGFAWPRG